MLLALGRASRGRGRLGSETTEFGMLLPVFVGMLAAIFDFGWMAYQRSALDAAVTAACRVGALRDPGKDDIDLLALQTATADALRASLAGGGLACDPADCLITIEPFGVRPTRNLRCTVTHAVDPLVGLALRSANMSATMAARMEWQR